MKYQVWCASVVSVVSGCIRSFLQATPPKTPHTPGWHGRGTNWHQQSLSAGPIPGFLGTSACRFRKARFQPHWHWKIRKSSNEMQEEIVSPQWRIQKTRTPKTTEKLGFLLLNLWDSEGFFSQPKSQTPITMVQFQMSHIEACPGSFTKRWNPVVGPSNSAKPCIFEGMTAIDRQRIKAESQGTAVQRSNLSISSQILPAVHKRCDGRKWYVVTIVETAALLLQSCLHHARMVVYRTKNQLSETSTDW